MSQPEIPESDLLRAFLLARVAQHSHSRYEATWNLTSNTAFLHERVLRLVFDESAPLDKDVRLTFFKILNEEANRQGEQLFAGEIADVRKYLEYLRLMGADISAQNSMLVDVETRMNVVMDRAKRAETTPITTVKEGIKTFGPVVKEFNRVKEDLKSLRHAVDEKAFELLQIYCRKIDMEASERLFKVLTQDL